MLNTNYILPISGFFHICKMNVEIYVSYVCNIIIILVYLGINCYCVVASFWSLPQIQDQKIVYLYTHSHYTERDNN